MRRPCKPIIALKKPSKTLISNGARSSDFCLTTNWNQDLRSNKWYSITPLERVLQREHGVLSPPMNIKKTIRDDVDWANYLCLHRFIRTPIVDESQYVNVDEKRRNDDGTGSKNVNAWISDLFVDAWLLAQKSVRRYDNDEPSFSYRKVPTESYVRELTTYHIMLVNNYILRSTIVHTLTISD